MQNHTNTALIFEIFAFIPLKDKGSVCALPPDGELWACQQILAEHENVNFETECSRINVETTSRVEPQQV